MERRIDEILGGARDAGKTVLTPYLCAGYPDNESLEPMLAASEHAGCPMGLVALAYRSPIFEGADLSVAMDLVCSRGLKLDAVIEQIRRARAVGAISGRFGLILAVSVAMLHGNRTNPTEVMRRFKAAGCDAILVTDAPLEEAAPYRAAADEAGVQFPMLVSVSTSQPRMAEIAKVATGCVVLVVRGGKAAEIAGELASAAARLRAVTTLPILTGMDAATPSHVRAASEHCDGVIIAGALARRVATLGGKSAGEQAGQFLRELSSGLQPARRSGGAA